MRKLPKSKLHTYNVHIARTAYDIYRNACIADRIYAITYEEARMKLNLLNESYGSIDLLLSICDDWKNEKPQVTNPDTHMTHNALTDRRINSYAGTLMHASGAFSSSIKYFRKQLSKYKNNDFQIMADNMANAFNNAMHDKPLNNNANKNNRFKIEIDDKFVYNNDVQIAKPAYDDTAHKSKTGTSAAVNNNDNKVSNVKNPNRRNALGSEAHGSDSSHINAGCVNPATYDNNNDCNADSNIPTANESIIDKHVLKKDNADIIVHRNADGSISNDYNRRKHYSKKNNMQNTRVSGMDNENMNNSSESPYKPEYDPFTGVSEHNVSMSSHLMSNNKNNDADIQHKHDDFSNDGIISHNENMIANTNAPIRNPDEKTNITDDNDDDIFIDDGNKKTSCVSINDISDEELFGIDDTHMTANKNDESNGNTSKSKVNNADINNKKNINNKRKNVNGSHEMTADEIDWSYLFNDSE